MTANPKLIAYIRVSDVGDREGEAFQSVRQQREAIEAIARLTAGASIAEEIVDLNVSGGGMERERVQDAIERVERGAADGIVVAYLDRWARTVDALSMFRRWADGGRWFLSAAEKFDASTSQGRSALGMMLLVARLMRTGVPFAICERPGARTRHSATARSWIALPRRSKTRHLRQAPSSP